MSWNSDFRVVAPAIQQRVLAPMQCFECLTSHLAIAHQPNPPILNSYLLCLSTSARNKPLLLHGRMS